MENESGVDPNLPEFRDLLLADGSRMRPHPSPPSPPDSHKRVSKSDCKWVSKVLECDSVADAGREESRMLGSEVPPVGSGCGDDTVAIKP